jgi:hypothetical protein
MSDVKYSVEIEFFMNSSALDASQSKVKGKVRDLHKEFAHLGSGFASGVDNALSGVVSSITDTVQKAAIVGGGVFAAGLGKALHEGIGFSQYTEDLTNGIAGTLAMLGDVPLDRGIQQAVKSTENLRKLALKLPGEFKDAANAFSYILPVGLDHGVDLARLEKIGAMGVAAAAALGINQATAGHETAALLEGRASSRMPLFAKLGLGSAKEFNALPFEKRLEAIESRYMKLGPAMDLYAGSWSGMTSAGTDQARNLAKTFAAPLFGSLKGELGRGLEWFGRNEDAAHAWAANLGVYVDRAFRGSIDAMRRWYGPATTFGHTLYSGIHSAFIRIEPYLVRFEDLALRFLQDPQAFDKLAHAASSLVALKAGSSALSFGMSSASGLGSLVAGLGSAGVGVADLAAFVGPAALGIGALALAAEGAAHALTDPTSAYHADAKEAFAGMAQGAKDIAVQFQHLDTNTRDARDAVGTALMETAGAFETGVAWWLYWINRTIEADNAQWDAARKNYLPQVIDDTAEALADLHKSIVEASNQTWLDTYNPIKRMGEAAAEREKVPNERKVPKHVTNVHGGIHINIEGSADPARVAVKAVDILQRRLMAPNGVRSNPNLAMMR